MTLPIANSQLKRLKFQPLPRGSLVHLAKRPSEFGIVAPESPRPPEMMSHVRINQGGDLSASDIALHELLIANAYEVDRKMEQLGEYSISMKALVQYLGDDARRDQVLRSMKRLREVSLDYDSEDRARRFRDVQMITAWREMKDADERICYTFPPPIRDLMRTMPAYAYVELAAIANGSMASKYSPALYKYLALQSTKKSWSMDANNEVFVQLSPAELAQIIQFPGWLDGTMNVAKLKDFVLRSLEDFAAVRRFQTEVEVKHESGRGRRIRYFNFTLTLRAPPASSVLVKFDQARMVRGADVDRFLTRSDTWVKAERRFSSK